MTAKQGDSEVKIPAFMVPKEPFESVYSDLAADWADYLYAY